MKYFIRLLLIVLGIGVILTMLSMIFLPDYGFLGNLVTRNDAYGEIIEFEEETILTDLSFDLENRHININYVDDDKLTISYYKRDNEVFNFNVLDGKLTVEHDFERFWANIFFFNVVSKMYLTVEVNIPNDWEISHLDVHVKTGDINLNPETQKTYDQVSIGSATGNVNVVNIAADELTISSSTGDLNLTDAVVTNLAKIRLSTGRISIKNLTSGSLDVNTSTGHVSLTEITSSDAVVDSSTGDIDITDSTFDTLMVDISTGKISLIHVLASDYRLDTSTGYITVVLSSIDDIRFNLKADTGKILFNGLSQGNEYQTQVGSVIFVAKTNTGNINIEVDA